MSGEEYGLWLALHTQEPIDASWWQTGLLASMQANINRAPNSAAYQVMDFIPDPWKPKPLANEVNPLDFVRKNYG